MAGDEKMEAIKKKQRSVPFSVVCVWGYFAILAFGVWGFVLWDSGYFVVSAVGYLNSVMVLVGQMIVSNYGAIRPPVHRF